MKKNTNTKQTASKTKKESKEEFAFYIGIDLGDKKSDICVLDEEGEDFLPAVGIGRRDPGFPFFLL